MLKRKAEKLLEDWKRSKDALLISGARQEGKSFFVREYGKAISLRRRYFIKIADGYGYSIEVAFEGKGRQLWSNL